MVRVRVWVRFLGKKSMSRDNFLLFDLVISVSQNAEPILKTYFKVGNVFKFEKF